MNSPTFTQSVLTTDKVIRKFASFNIICFLQIMNEIHTHTHIQRLWDKEAQKSELQE